MIDRAIINQALAKTLAYQAAGKPELASQWAHRLIELLRDSGVPDLRH
jgi:hypothetical protein